MNLNWVEWGTAPQWAAAVATVGSLFYAFGLFRRQRETLNQQSEDRLRDHARFISAWINENRTLTVRNGGEEPADGVSIYHSREEGLDDGARLMTLYNTDLLPPLKTLDTGATVPLDMGTEVFRLVFTDARGVRWVRESGGRLIRIDSKLDAGKVGAWEAIWQTNRRRWFRFARR